MTIEDDISNLSTLNYLGMALVQFVYSLQNGKFQRKKSAWIYSWNFVGFEIRYQRVQRLNLLIRSIDFDPAMKRILPVDVGPLTYIRAEIKTPRQLACATAYVELSWRDWYRETFYKDPAC